MAQGFAVFHSRPDQVQSRLLWQRPWARGRSGKRGRLQIPDADALELIGVPGKIESSGKRPRFRLTTHQTRLAGYLSEFEAALENAGLTPAWLLQRDRAAHRDPRHNYLNTCSMRWPSYLTDWKAMEIALKGGASSHQAMLDLVQWIEATAHDTPDPEPTDPPGTLSPRVSRAYASLFASLRRLHRDEVPSLD